MFESIFKVFELKTLVIGFDGGTWTVLDHLIAKGRMPTLKKIKEKHDLKIIFEKEALPEFNDKKGFVTDLIKKSALGYFPLLMDTLTFWKRRLANCSVKLRPVNHSILRH